MSLNRLQKIISGYGLISRWKAELLIEKSSVKLKGSQPILEEKEDPNFDHILVNRKDLAKKLNHKVFLLNKP